MDALLLVGLQGVLSSCSAAGMWRVRDLAGLGRDDLFSGLRYALSWYEHKHGEESASSSSSSPAACITQQPLGSFHFTFPSHLWGRGEGREHAEEGRNSLSSASTRGLRLRLQAEPGRGGWLSNPRRCAAIFKSTARVGLWTEGVARGGGGTCRRDGRGDRWRNKGVR